MMTVNSDDNYSELFKEIIALHDTSMIMTRQTYQELLEKTSRVLHQTLHLHFATVQVLATMIMILKMTIIKVMLNCKINGTVHIFFLKRMKMTMTTMMILTMMMIRLWCQENGEKRHVGFPFNRYCHQKCHHRCCHHHKCLHHHHQW